MEKEELLDCIINEEDYRILLESAFSETVNYLKSTMHKEVRKFRKEDEVFLKRHHKIWNEGFVVSEAMYLFCYEAAEDYVQYVDNLEDVIKKQHQFVFVAMHNIHGRALQEFLEIITLMKNGFADGAYARWRSMYELSVIATFIIENGEEVAQAYIEACDSDDQYDWAKKSHKFDYQKHNHISFKDIVKNCSFNSKVWNKQYRLANKIIHASSQGTFGRLSNMKLNNVILTGRCDYGITTPAEHSAISLAQISIMFFNIFPNSDSLLAMNCIDEWVDIVREIYFKIHDETFPEDEPINFLKK